MSKRQLLQQKLDTYQRLVGLLEPFRDPLISVQPNLATRDGALATELARTRALAARVSGRLNERKKDQTETNRNAANSPGGAEHDDENMYEDEDEHKKVMSLLSK